MVDVCSSITFSQANLDWSLDTTPSLYHPAMVPGLFLHDPAMIPGPFMTLPDPWSLSPPYSHDP